MLLFGPFHLSSFWCLFTIWNAYFLHLASANVFSFLVKVDLCSCHYIIRVHWCWMDIKVNRGDSSLLILWDRLSYCSNKWTIPNNLGSRGLQDVYRLQVNKFDTHTPIFSLIELIDWALCYLIELIHSACTLCATSSAISQYLTTIEQTYLKHLLLGKSSFWRDTYSTLWQSVVVKEQLDFVLVEEWVRF